MIVYRPTLDEMVKWGRVGLRRTAHSLSVNRRQMYGRDSKENRWGSDIEAAIAEGVVAKHMDTIDWWMKLAEKDASDRWVGDVWPKIDVKNTKYKNGHLLIADDYPDDHYYILVCGELGEYTICGHLLARDAMKKKWERNDTRGGRKTKTYWVPQDSLNEFDPAFLRGYTDDIS